MLSEFAGAAQDLDGALIVNPYDIEAIKRSLVDAIDDACRRARRADEDDARRCPAQRRAPLGTQLPRLGCSRRRRCVPAIWRCAPTAASVVGSETVRNLR